MRRFLVSLLILLSLIVLARTKVFIIPFSHLDIGFTATQREVSQQYAKMFSQLVDVLGRIPDFSFTVESFWQFQQWLNSKPSQGAMEKFREYVAEGRIEFAGAFANMHTGFLNTLTLRESVEFPLRELRKLGFDAKVCMQNDVPGFSEHFPDILQDLGIKYLMIGINDAYASVLNMPSASVFWWEGPRGGKVLTYVTKNSYAEGIMIRSASGLEQFVEAVHDSGYPYDVLPVLVAFDNAGYEPGIMALLRFVRTEYENMDVVISTPSKFFEELEKRYSEFPTYGGDWSGWWEIVKTGGPYSSSTARWVQDSLEDFLEHALISKHDMLYDSILEKLLLYGEHSSACGAGWPGLLSLEQINESNETVVLYATEAYKEFHRFLETEFRSTNKDEFIVINRAGSPTECVVKLPYESAREGDLAIVEISGNEHLAWYFSEPATNAYEPYSRGFKLYVPLNPGENKVKIKEMRTTHFQNQEMHRIENEFYRVDLHLDGTFDIFDKQFKRPVLNQAGKIQTDFTTRQYAFETLSLEVSSAVSAEYPQEKILDVTFEPGSPFVHLRIILPCYKKAVIAEYFLNRDKLPYVPYEKHSSNYYVCFPLSDTTKMYCTETDGNVKQIDLFPFVRPREVCLNGYVVADAGAFNYVLASREAFMVDLPFDDDRNKILRFHLLRHYSEAAVKNKGIVKLQDVEPNTPKLIRFSFLISTSRLVDPEIPRDFLRPVIVVKSEGVIP